MSDPSALPSFPPKGPPPGFHKAIAVADLRALADDLRRIWHDLALLAGSVRRWARAARA